MHEVDGVVKELHNKTISHINTTKMSLTELSTSLPTTPKFSTMATDKTYLYKFTDFIYPGFYFERLVYLYVWEMLVVLTSFFNVIVISILLRKEFRNPTNVILAAIAISDSLTGLSTLPTYRMAHQQYETNNTFTAIVYGRDDGEWQSVGECKYATPLLYFVEPQDEFQHYLTNDQTESSYYVNCPYYDGFILEKEQCEWFMISKLFISPSFRLISIYLTMFVVIHRFISVAAPYKVRSLKTKHVVVICLMIVLLSPIPHAYHLFDDKTHVGACAWFVANGSCQGGCIQLLMFFIIMHLIPCSVLLSFTIMFLRKLRKHEGAMRDMIASSPQIKKRVLENRRMVIIVVAIVIVFFIPEFPSACFILICLIQRTNPDIQFIDFKTGRAMAVAYEVSMVVFFHANIYIYTLFNPKFRTSLVKTFVQPVRQCIGSFRRVSAILKSRNIEQRQHRCVKLCQMTNTNTALNTENKPVVASPEFMNLVSVSTTQTTQEDEGSV